jgi:asparagine synthase (glutamine-hydrolysing)
MQKENGIVFASEVKAILEHKSLNKEIKEEAIADFFVLGKVIGDKTLFKEIKALPPASIFMNSKDETSIDKYWEFVYNYDGISKNTEKSIVNELVKTFGNSIAKRLKSSHRYACALSGGLDSRTVLSAVPKTERDKIIAFTFGDHLCDEIKVAKAVANNLKVRHKEIEYEPGVLTKYFEEVVYLTDGMDDVSVSNMPYAYKHVRKFAEIDFQGFAMDLFLGGSFLDPYIFTLRSDSELADWLYSKMILFSESLLSEILTTQYYKKVKGKAFKSILREIKKLKGKTYPDKADSFFMTNHVSRFTILGSVIGRNFLEETFPTLDNEFIDVILKIPPEFRFRHKIYMRFLRHLAPRMIIIPCEATMVPPIAPLVFWKIGRTTMSFIQKIKKMTWKITKGRILIRNTHGYIHVDEYIRTNKQWKNVIYTLLLNKDSEIYKKGIFELEGVRRLVREHESGKTDHAQRITHIITFELFLREFLKTNNPNIQ